MISKNYVWKERLNMEGSPARYTLVTLYDLLYNEEGKYYNEATEGFSKGLKLDHDTILYDTKECYDTFGEYSISVLQKPVSKNLIGLILPTVDKLSPFMFVENENYIEQSVLYSGDIKKKGYYIYNKQSFLFPTEEQRTEALKIPLGSSIIFTVGTGESTFFRLVDNITFLSSVLTLHSSYSVYNRLCLNFINNNVKRFVAKFTAFNVLDNSGGESQEKLNKAVNIVHNPALKTTYVWVCCSFLGDFISPESFNQELNQKSDVVHRNLRITTSGDYRNFNETSEGEEKVKTLSGYFPQTTPLIDRNTERFDKQLKGISSNWEGNGYFLNRLTKMFLSAKEGKPYNIGAFESYRIKNDLIDIEYNNPSLNTPIYPIGWFDPFISYYKAMGDVVLSAENIEDFLTALGKHYYTESKKYSPTHLFSSEATSIIENQIISPTIDDINEGLKRIIEGRGSDIEFGDNLVSIESLLSDSDITISEDSNKDNKTNEDLRLPRMEEYALPFFSEGSYSFKKGNPLAYEMTSSSIDTKRYLSNADTLIHTILTDLNYIFNAVLNVKNGNLNYENDKQMNYTPLETLENNKHLFSTYFNRPQVIEAYTKYQGVVKNKQEADEQNYTLRDRPYSLRELEALIKGLRYNLVTLAQFMMREFAITSGKGKTTIHQFHREYSGDIEAPKPETTFESIIGEDKTGSIYSTYGKAIQNASSENVNFEVNIDGSLLKSNDALTFLAKDGTFRSIGEYAITPILDTKY